MYLTHATQTGHRRINVILVDLLIYFISFLLYTPEIRKRLYLFAYQSKVHFYEKSTNIKDYNFKVSTFKYSMTMNIFKKLKYSYLVDKFTFP